MSTVTTDSSASITNEAVQPIRTLAKSRVRLTSISAKMLMAITGSALLVFVAVHMLGNLQIYLGQEKLNAYAKFLKSMPLVLWSARLGLITVFSLHLGLAVYLKRQNRRARPQQYVVSDPIETTLASRTMLTSGMVIFAFLIYHLLHFTLGITDPANHNLFDAAGRHDVYSMVVLSFSNVYVSTAYIIAMLFLGLHLSHASASVLQTFGVTSKASRSQFEKIGLSIAVILMLGNISIPVAVLLGFVGLPEGVMF